MLDTLDSGRRFVLGKTDSSRLEIDFFNLYTWLLKFVEKKNVLDIACGSGLASFLMAHKADEVIGVDLSTEAIDFAKNHYNLVNLKFLVSDVFDHPLPEDYFDVVVCSLTLEQIESSRQIDFLIRLKKSLKVNGVMILVTPNKKVTSPSKFVGHDWNKKEFYKYELIKIITEAGLEIKGWYGQRLVLFLYTNYFVRKFIGLSQKILKTNLGFYGRRESPQIKPLKFYWEPRLFVLLLSKK